MASKKARPSSFVSDADRVRQRRRGQRSGRDDGRRPFFRRQSGDFLAADGDARMRTRARRVTARENPSRSTASAPPAGSRCASARSQDQRAGAAHLLMQQADRIVFPIVGPERVGADEFRKPVRLMRVGSAHRAHLVQNDLAARLRCLPGCLAARQSAADDVDYVCHDAAIANAGILFQPRARRSQHTLRAINSLANLSCP